MQEMHCYRFDLDPNIPQTDMSETRHFVTLNA